MSVFNPLPAILLVIGLSANAYAGSAMVQSVDEEVAMNRALEKVPEGKKVSDSSCKSIQMGMFDTAYQCTVYWD